MNRFMKLIALKFFNPIREKTMILQESNMYRSTNIQFSSSPLERNKIIVFSQRFRSTAHHRRKSATGGAIIIGDLHGDNRPTVCMRY